MMRRPIALAALLTSSLVLAACGGDHEEVKLAEVEGVQVSVNELLYQVQASRILNVADVEDSQYVRGVPISEQSLGDDSEWFAVFVRAKNDTDETHASAEEFVIEDTVGNEYRPVKADNSFQYEAGDVAPDGVIPTPDSPSADSSTKGSLLLFKITRASLENRPLEFIIKDPEQPTDEEAEGIVDLDV